MSSMMSANIASQTRSRSESTEHSKNLTICVQELLALFYNKVELDCLYHTFIV